MLRVCRGRGGGEHSFYTDVEPMIQVGEMERIIT